MKTIELGEFVTVKAGTGTTVSNLYPGWWAEVLASRDDPERPGHREYRLDAASPRFLRPQSIVWRLWVDDTDIVQQVGQPTDRKRPPAVELLK